MLKRKGSSMKSAQGKLLRHLVLGHCKHIHVNADTVFVTPGEVS